MKINQAAELAGITSKNIRFYEDQGLIAPARDAGNGYRDYSMEDVEQLYRIKLLRMLGISCENIRRLQSGELDFDRCMDDRVTELEKTGSNIGHMKTMCRVPSTAELLRELFAVTVSIPIMTAKFRHKSGLRLTEMQLFFRMSRNRFIRKKDWKRLRRMNVCRHKIL
jgi:DNA-binding transcriptional MerR regulator